MTGLPMGGGTLGAPMTGGATAPRSRGRRRMPPFLRVGGCGLARGSGGAARIASKGFWSVAQEREAQPRLFDSRSHRPPSFGSRDFSQPAISLFFLPQDARSSGLLHLSDALTTQALVIEQGSAHLGQPSVDSRWQWRVTWPAVGVVLHIDG